MANNENLNRPPTLGGDFLHFFQTYITELGEDATNILQEAGIAIPEDSQIINPVPVATYSKLLEQAAKKLDDPCLGMNMANAPFYGPSVIEFSIMRSAPSIRVGLQTLIRYSRFLEPGLSITFSIQPELTEFGFTLLGVEDTNNKQLNEFLLIGLLRIINASAQKPMPVTKICCEHSRPKNKAEESQFFSAPVKYGQKTNVIIFKSSYLNERFLTANNSLFKILDDALSQHIYTSDKTFDLIEAVSNEITRIMPFEKISIEQIAKNLSLSASTLRRRLANENTSFQDIKQRTMEKHAKYLLAETNFQLYPIALELGYSELSAFSRAFRSWSGESPQKYRERIQSEGDDQ